MAPQEAQQLPILIAGAGLAGLLLARSLYNHNIPFDIYERDSAGSSRSQGYRIRLSHQGINAIADVLTPEMNQRFRDGTADFQFGKITLFDARTMEAQDLPGNRAPRGGGEVRGMERRFLRTMLFEDIEDFIHFNKHVTGYEVTDTGVVALFSDGTKSKEGSLLVGAEGVHSKITKQLTKGQLKVYDTQARMIHGQSPKAAFQAFAKGGFGGFAFQDDSRPGYKLFMITTVRDEPGEDKHFGWTLVGGPGSFSPPNDDFSIQGQPAVDMAVELTKDWHEDVRRIFTDQRVPDTDFLKMSTSSPDGVPEWTNEPRVTLIGDAAHNMTPAAGIGANTALRDAAYLGRLLAEAGGWADGLTIRFEQGMRVYATENVQESFDGASKRFGIERQHLQPLRNL